MDFLQTLDVAYKLCAVIGSLSALLLLIWKRRKWIPVVRDFLASIRDLVAMSPDIKFIVKELKPNGGTSLKDKVNSLDRKQNDLEHEVNDLRGVNNRQTEILTGQNETLSQQNGVLDEFGDRIDRLILHQAKNDLHTSRLFTEAEDRQKRREGRAKPSSGDPLVNE